VADEANAPGREPTAGRSQARTLAVNFAHLAALSAFALAQPLFDLLGESPEFFAVRGSSRWDIVLFALAVILLPPAVLVAIEAIAGLVSRPLQRAAQLVFVGAGAAVIALQVLKDTAGLTSTGAIVGLAALAGAAVALLYRRAPLVRSFLTVLALAPVFFLTYFLFVSPVAELTLARDPDVQLAHVRASAPVVMVVFDELPVSSLLDEQGEIDDVRYPSFAELAARSTWFRNASTVSYTTTNAVPALLTGMRASEGPPVFASHPRNLFTLLGGAYRMNVVETYTRLCPRVVCTEQPAADATVEPASLYSDASIVYLHLVAPPRVERRFPSITQDWMNFGRDDHDDIGGLLDEALEEPSGERLRRSKHYHAAHVRAFEEFLRSIEPSDEPSLNFTHILFPHQPWWHFPSGSQSSIGDSPTIGLDARSYRWREPFLTRQAYQRHLLQVGYVDRLVGELLDRLRETGLYDRSLVVVTADHGVSFHEGQPQRDPTEATLPDIAFVPLFVKQPVQRQGETVDYHVETIDVLPTIADALGIEVPWRIDGRSALQDPQRGTVRVERQRKETGDEVAVPFATALAQQEEAVARKAALFGTGDWASLFAAGEHGDLVGRPLSTFGTIGSAADRATIDDRVTRELLAGRDLGVALVPSPLQGSVTGSGARTGRTLAVAVDGRIAAVASTYADAGGVRFSALAPESAFHPGQPSRVEVFWVDGPAGAVRLSRLAFGS
jgi:hypothetical protein